MWVVLRPIPTKREVDVHGSLFERKILVKSPEPGNRAQRKVDYTNYYAIAMRTNYFRKLSPKIITQNYEWKLSVSTSITHGVSKSTIFVILLCDWLFTPKIFKYRVKTRFWIWNILFTILIRRLWIYIIRKTDP